MGANFRTCFLGGFDKKDVISFIEKQSKEYQDQIDSLNRDNDILKEAVLRMENERLELLPKAQQHDEVAEERSSLQQQVEALNAQVASLKEENDRLGSAAQEYYRIKDHIAEIEISAHRRTEEFRAEAISQLKQLISRQRDWCTQERQRYLDINTSAKQKMQEVQLSLSQLDDAGFAQMLDSLASLENEMK